MPCLRDLQRTPSGDPVGKAERWLRKTYLELTAEGEILAREATHAGFGTMCCAEGCENLGTSSCRQRCSDQFFCPTHNLPANHGCRGRMALLVEDCSQDSPFFLHLPLRQLTPASVLFGAPPVPNGGVPAGGTFSSETRGGASPASGGEVSAEGSPTRYASEYLSSFMENLRASTEENVPHESMYHLVQQEDVIWQIHAEKLPPD